MSAKAVCSACHKEKPVSEFHADSSKASGHKSKCKECFLGKKPNQLKPPPPHARMTGTKVCGTCKKDKPIDDFAFNRSEKDGRAHKCRECFKLYWKKYNAAGNASSVPKVAPIKIPTDPKMLDLDLADQILPFAGQAKQGTWTIEEAYELAMLVRSSRQADPRAQIKDIVLKIKHHKPSACTNMWHELIQAAKQGISLKEYFDRGRPFRPGGRVLVKKEEAKKGGRK